MSKRSIVSRLLLCTLVSLPLPAFAQSQISISSPSCDGVFIVQGNLEGVAGVDLTIGYDAATLANPRVNWGGLVAGMTNGANPVNPIRMLAVSVTKSINGSGTVATITFDKLGASAGQITTFKAKMVDLHSATVATQVVNVPAACGNAANDNGGTSGGTSGGTAGNSGSGNLSGGDSGTTTPPPTIAATPTPTGYYPYVVGGTVTLPGTESATASRESVSQTASQESVERPAVPRETAPAYQPREEAPAPKAAEEPAPAPKRVQSVLEKFKLFTGEKTVKNLTALFDRDSAATFSQSPAIVIADGESTAKVTIAKVKGEKAPNFAFTSAHYVSLARGGDGGWEIEVRPDKDAVTASVTMLVNGTMQEIPLAVAPRAVIGKGGAPTESDFLTFLKERGTPAAPKLDLNADGKRDYVDDYIFTANYLVKVQEQAQKKKAAQQKP